jgi:hypothetical protein
MTVIIVFVMMMVVIIDAGDGHDDVGYDHEDGDTYGDDHEDVQ